LRISHEELLGVTGRLQTLLGPNQNPDVVSVTFSSDGRTIEFSDWPTAAGLQALPDRCGALDLTFDRPDAAVSKVVLQLGDYSRTLRVYGRSQAQVEAVTTLLKADLGAFSTMFGGFWLRLVAALLLTLPAAVFAGSFGAHAATWRETLRSKPGALIRPALAISLLYSIVLLPPWSTWLPGTSIVRGMPSLLAQYSPELSLLGAGLTTLFGIREWLRSRKSRAAA